MILINSNTRHFNIPGADLVFGVTDDSDVERKYFQCPRYVGDNLDLAACFIRINFRTANGKMDSYLVDDLAIDGDNVTFSWLLSPKVTEYRGQVKFVMCAVGPDLKLKWHTAQGTGQVMEGLEPDNSHVESQTADVVAQLIALVNAQTVAVEKTGADQVTVVKTAAATATLAAVAEIETKRASALSTIPSDYTAIQNSVRDAANAIRGKVSGEVIRVDDVSPMEHYPVVKVHGKNLIPFPYRQSTSSDTGGTFVSQADGGVIASGTPTGYASFNLYQGEPLVKSGSAVLSCSGDLANVSVAIAIYDSGENVLLSKETWQNAPPIVLNLDLFPSATKWIVYLKRGTPGIEMSGVAYPQLELGEVATEYTPYVDPSAVKLARVGRNLLDPSKIVLANCTAIENGVKASIGGIYYCEIYANHLRNYLQNHDGATITFSVGNMVADSYIAIVITYEDGTYAQKTSYTNSTTLTIDNQGRTIRSVIVRPLAKRETFTDTTSIITNLQLEIGSVATDFRKADPVTESIPAYNGSVSGIKAMYPTLTLLTDTPGITIECEYSRDTNKVIAEILEKITAIGG